MLMLQACAYEIEAGNLSTSEKRCAQAVETWIEAGLGFRLDESGTRLFDPAEVICFTRWSGVCGHDRFWEDNWVRTARAFVTEMSLTSGADRFHIGLKRTFDLRRFDVGARVRLRLPLPLTSAYHSEIQVTPIAEQSPDWPVTLSEGRMEVRLPVTDDREVSIGADIDLVALSEFDASPGGRLDPAESDLYLRAAEDLIRITPRISALATHLAGTGSARSALNAFWTFMMDNICIGAIRYDEISPDTAIERLLDGGWCDCQLGSSLFIALCRARGLPARLVGGHFLYRLAPTKHYWAEVWLEDEGWRPFDLSCWDLSLGGRDAVWRDRFAGHLDYRMVTECFPRWFTGPMSVRFSPQWQMLQAAADTGVSTEFSDISDGSLIYRDEVLARRTT